jgi:hypothetical protein
MGTWAVSQNGLLYGEYFSAPELARAQFCFLFLGLVNGFLRHFEPLNLHKHITIFSEKLLLFH